MIRAAAQGLAFLAEALGVLAGDRTRTFLTVLGLAIGVAAVIAIQILGQGMAGAVTGVLGGFNDRSFFLFPSGRQADFTRAELRVRDLDRVPALFTNVLLAIPGGNVARLVVVGHRRARFGITDDADVSFTTVPMRYGRGISRADVAGAAHVATISDAAYAKLFPGGGDPVGASLRIGDLRYAVIGVQARPTTGLLPISFGGDVRIPYTTFEREYVRAAPLLAARFVVADTSTMAQTEAGVRAYFRDARAGRAQYQTFDRKSFATLVDGVFAGLSLAVALIGAVSLVVAGIGIMNIMLVSVSERTREIGVRKAIGATSAQVLAQFVIEALLLSVVGCAIGLALGLATGALVDRYGLVAISGVVPDVPWAASVAIAVGFATLVTLVFGTYPAYRAARLDPIEALRRE